MKYQQINKKTKEVENTIVWDGTSDISFILENYDLIIIEEPDIVDVEESPIPQYILDRIREYPPRVDFIDAYYWNSKGDDTKMNEYIQKCDEVKSKYPKPQ
jgi:hypothetical protein